MQITSLSSGTFVLDGFVYSICSLRFAGLRYSPFPIAKSAKYI